jgi:hypothetical protein
VSHTRDMLDASPTGVPLGVAEVAAAMDACLDCLQACTSCADADLAEEDVAAMGVCIARCLTCADVCEISARVLRDPPAETSSSSSGCCRLVSKRARAPPRSVTGTPLIIVIARSASRFAAPAWTRVPRCSMQKLSRSSTNSTHVRPRAPKRSHTSSPSLPRRRLAMSPERSFPSTADAPPSNRQPLRARRSRLAHRTRRDVELACEVHADPLGVSGGG